MSQLSIRQRIGVFGGTFDPIHLGHLLIAEYAWEQLGLSEVRFIPAALAPHKQGQPATEAKYRAEMIRLAIGGNPHFTLDQRELRRGGTSYTVDTLSELKSELPATELVFLMGADSLADFPTWREPAKICELAFVVVLARGGQSPPELKILQKYLPLGKQPAANNHLLHMPQIEISSTEIRRRVSMGKSIRYQVAAAVEAYIAATQLYRKAPLA